MMDVKPFLTDKRKERLKSVIIKRQFDLCVVLENIHDPHNIAAVIRSCDAVGIKEIYALVTDPRIDLERYELDNNYVSSGSRKWVHVHIHTSVKDLITALRKNYNKILGTHLAENAVSLYEIDFNADSTALVFGNEHAGLSEELLAELDGNFIIPQYGMVQSLNISVACAVSVFEALRQKETKDLYMNNEWDQKHEDLYEEYVLKSKPRLTEEPPEA